MADKPILFSGPMVRALLDGRKTQTRRILKPQPPMGSTFFAYDNGDNGFFARFLIEDERGNADLPLAPIQFMAGDRLWVREHWKTDRAYEDLPPRDMGGEEPLIYLADSEVQRWGWKPSAMSRWGRHRQAMHMPRWASRLTNCVTGVQVERLQDISEADAIAEGLRKAAWEVNAPNTGTGEPDLIICEGWSSDRVSAFKHGVGETAADGFRILWDSLNADRGFGWDTNPWVTTTTFTVHKKNIDQMGDA